LTAVPSPADPKPVGSGGALDQALDVPRKNGTASLGDAAGGLTSWTWFNTTLPVMGGNLLLVLMEVDVWHC